MSVIESPKYADGAALAEGRAARPPVFGLVLRLPHLVLAASVALAVFTAIFWKWTATSAWGFPRFVVAALALGYVPGRALLDLGRPRLRPLEDVTLSLLLGLTVGAALFWVAGFLGLRPLFFLWPPAALVAYGYRRRASWRQVRRVEVPLRGPHLLLLGVMVICLAPFAVLPMWYRNLSLLPQGGMLFPTLGDDFLHVSLATELTHCIPPQVPFLSGIPVNYNYGMDLICAMFSSAARLSVLDMTVRYLPTLSVVLAALAIFCFGRAWRLPEYAAAFTPFLVLWGEDLSFIPGCLTGSHDYWSVAFFLVPSTFSFYYINPILPGLGILFGGFFCLVKACEEETTAWPLAAAFFFAALVQFKVFAAGQALTALVIAGVIFRDRRWLKLLGLTAVLMLPLLVGIWLGNRMTGVQPVRLVLARSPFVSMAFSAVGFAATHTARHLAAIYEHGITRFRDLIDLFLIGLPVYLVGSLGVRVMAFPSMLKAVFRPSAQASPRAFLAIFILLGIVITLTCTVRSESTEYNNAVWFYAVSKMVAWVFVAEVIWRLIHGRKRAAQILVLGLATALSIPSTVQTMARLMLIRPEAIGKGVVETAQRLGRACRPGQVVFCREGPNMIVVSLTTCRTPFADIARTYAFAPLSEIERRKNDLNAFWSAGSAEDLRREILSRYHVNYLVVETGIGKGFALPANVSRPPMFQNDEFAVYLVQR